MRKFKKILSAILVMALVFTFSTFTALADGESVQSSTKSLNKLEFSKTFKAEEGNILPTKEFEFLMEPVDLGSNSGNLDSKFNVPKYSGVSLGTKAKAVIKFEGSNDSQSVTKSGEFDLSGVNFKSNITSAATQYALFSYTVKENAPLGYSDDYINYSQEVYDVDVCVDTDGVIQAYLVYKEGSSSNDKVTQISFTNEYKKSAKANELIIAKIVEGSMGDKNHDFEFSLTVNDSSTNSETFKGTIYRNGSDEDIDITKGTAKTFTLKDGEYLSIFGIPTGAVYTVEETAVSGYSTSIKCSTKSYDDYKTTEYATVTGNKYEAQKENTPIVNGSNTVEFTNTSTYKTNENIAELTFTKNFVNKKGGILPETTFTFTMTPDNGVVDNATSNKDGLKIRKGYKLVNDTATISYETFTASKQTGVFNLATTEKMTGPAAYRYIVQESIPVNKKEFITYDETKYKVDLITDKDGNIVDIISVKSDDTTNTNTDIVFENECTEDDLIIMKKVTGSMGDTYEPFYFTLDIPGPGTNMNLTTGAAIKGVIKRNNGENENVQIIVGQYYRFYLKDGEALVIEGIPEGMIYTVTEDEYKDYDTTITLTTNIIDANGAKVENIKTVSGSVYSASSQETAIVDGGNTLVFTNNKDAKANTGVKLDVTPYIIIFGLAAAGVIIYVIKRKKRS